MTIDSGLDKLNSVLTDFQQPRDRRCSEVRAVFSQIEQAETINRACMKKIKDIHAKVSHLSPELGVRCAALIAEKASKTLRLESSSQNDVTLNFLFKLAIFCETGDHFMQALETLETHPDLFSVFIFILEHDPEEFTFILEKIKGKETFVVQMLKNTIKNRADDSWNLCFLKHLDCMDAEGYERVQANLAHDKIGIEELFKQFNTYCSSTKEDKIEDFKKCLRFLEPIIQKGFPLEQAASLIPLFFYYGQEEVYSFILFLPKDQELYYNERLDLHAVASLYFLVPEQMRSFIIASAPFIVETVESEDDYAELIKMLEELSRDHETLAVLMEGYRPILELQLAEDFIDLFNIVWMLKLTSSNTEMSRVSSRADFFALCQQKLPSFFNSVDPSESKQVKKAKGLASALMEDPEIFGISTESSFFDSLLGWVEGDSAVDGFIWLKKEAQKAYSLTLPSQLIQGSQVRFNCEKLKELQRIYCTAPLPSFINRTTWSELTTPLTQKLKTDVGKEALAQLSPDSSDTIILGCFESPTLQGLLEELKEPLTPYQSYFVAYLTYLLSQSTEKEHAHYFSPQEEALLLFAMSVQKCPAGKMERLSEAYSLLPREFRFQQLSGDRKERLEFELSLWIQEFFQQELSQQGVMMKRLIGRRNPEEPSHQTLFLKNRLGPHIGLNHKVVFDLHYDMVYERLKTRSLQRTAELFGQFVTPEKWVQFLQKKFNEMQVKDKSTLYQTIVNTFPECATPSYWDLSEDVELTREGVFKLSVLIGVLQ